MMVRFVFAFIVVGTGLSVGAGEAYAKPEFLSDFIAAYPSATRLFTCGTCHFDFDGPSDDLTAAAVSGTGGGILNSYGLAFEEAGGNDNASAAFASIAAQDSDDDGTGNLAEIVMASGFMPGYACNDYMQAYNAPTNLADFVDPELAGCGLGGTSTTTTTSTVSTTSTTLFSEPGCAQPVTDGPTPLASDCLWILNVAVAIRTCDVPCLCAPKGSLPVTATDALICLRVATGSDVALQCPCSGATTTTSTTTLGSTTSTTTTTTTTTTTLGDPFASGRQLYDTVCAGCHSAGSYDPSGFASNLAGKGNSVVNNLGSIDSAMSSITLSNQEVTDVAAFLNSL